MKKFAELKNKARDEIHSMVVVDNRIYVIDGKSLYQIEPPVDTLWQRIGKFLGLTN